MAGSSLWRAAAVSAQVAALIVVLGCESSSPTAPPVVPSVPPTPVPATVGAIGGIVTINGEARPMVWVELQPVGRGGWAWAFGPTLPDGSWEYRRVPAGDYVVVIKTPPELTCDATRKSATVGTEPTVVNFACFGHVKASILGVATNEFGTVASARITLTGRVSREAISNGDGFFAFEEDLPPGEYQVLGWCKTNPVTVSVRDGAPAFAMVDCS